MKGSAAAVLLTARRNYMKDTDYAYGVARIRANEKKLLSSQDIESLIACPNLSAAAQQLERLGWTERRDGGFDISAAVRKQNEQLWTLLCESVPDREILKALTVQNDFFNLKAALKAMFSGTQPERLFAYPTSLDLEELREAVFSHRFSALDGDFAKALQSAYDAAGTTLSGQSADVIIDRAALEYLQKTAKSGKCPLVYEIAAFTAAAANVKVAFRSMRTEKSRSFLETAVAECELLDREELIEAALKGENALTAFLYKTDLEKGARLLLKSSAAFEKWCDDEVLEKAKKAKYMFFGFEPICAYYFAKQAEIKSVRVIFGAKESGAPDSVIRERVRALYV